MRLNNKNKNIEHQIVPEFLTLIENSNLRAEIMVMGKVLCLFRFYHLRGGGGKGSNIKFR